MSAQITGEYRSSASHRWLKLGFLLGGSWITRALEANRSRRFFGPTAAVQIRVLRDFGLPSHRA